MLSALAAALRRRGHRVSAVQHFGRDARISTSGTERAASLGAGYRAGRRVEVGPREARGELRFVAAPAPLQRAARLAHGLAPRHGPAYYEASARPVRAALAGRPDVLHVFGVALDPALAVATRAAARAGVPVVAHFHGGEARLDRLTGSLRRGNLRRCARILATHPDLLAPWQRAGWLADPGLVRACPETSTRLAETHPEVPWPYDEEPGSPCCVLLGRLHPVKDPLTSLAGFARLACRRPAARLHVLPLSDELLPALRTTARDDPRLRGRVHVHPPADRATVAGMLARADLLLQSSRREWSSLAVLEALAFGCLPVVSDIPALRALTAGGRHGALFPLGDDRALAAAALRLWAGPDGAAGKDGGAARAERAEAARRHFQAALSFDAIAARIEAIDRELLARREARA